MAAAGLEVATGLALVVAPSLFAILVLGGDLDGIGRTVGRLGGATLLALAWACWPRPGQPARPGLDALLLFSAATVLILLAHALTGGSAGPMLWPALLIHSIMIIVLARADRSARHAEVSGGTP